MSICDAFVYIPQYGSGTASLNVTVAGSIILHHFGLWAGMQESDRVGYKYVLSERPKRTHPRGVCSDPEEVHAERAERRRQGDWLDGEGDRGGLEAEGGQGVLVDLFGDGDA